MKKKVLSGALVFAMLVALLPLMTDISYAAGKTRTIDCDTFAVEVSNVYAMDSASGYATEGYVTTYCVVIPAGSTIKITKKAAGSYNDYLLWPFNEAKFSGGPMYPTMDYACHYDDAIYLPFALGDKITTVVNNEYFFNSWKGSRLFNLRIFAVDAQTLVQFGGPKPSAKDSYSGPDTAGPSKTEFVVKGKGVDTVMDAPQVVKQAYNIKGTNYLQLRAIAVLLNRTAAQFNIGWDGQYAVIEPGKAFTGTVTGSKMASTKNVKNSSTKFKMNGEVFSFSDARLINGSTNYIQLREFAQKLTGTASQFNVYWDTALSQAIIQPGAPYTGTKYEEASTVLEKVEGTDILPDGEYYMQINGKFIYPVAGGQYWLELKTARPPLPFVLKFEGEDGENGAKYTISYDGQNIIIPWSADGAQLESTTNKTPHYFRINRYASFSTIRDYLNQKLLVVGSGSTGGGNTIVKGISSTGSAPDSGKITFLAEAASGGAKTTVQVKTYPGKTTYKLGEGFDTSGISAVSKSGNKETDISGKVTFYTSKTVELTQGRPFTTTGQKVVEIRYNGEKIAEYTIVVVQ